MRQIPTRNNRIRKKEKAGLQILQKAESFYNYGLLKVICNFSISGRVIQQALMK